MQEVEQLRTLREAARQATSASLAAQRKIVSELNSSQTRSTELTDSVQLVKLLRENERRLWDLYMQALRASVMSYDSARAVVIKRSRLLGLWKPGPGAPRERRDVRVVEVRGALADSERG